MNDLNPTPRRLLLLLGLSALVIVSAGTVLAQGHGRGHDQCWSKGRGPDHARGLERMTALLDLSEEQQTAIAKIHEQAQAKRLETRKEIMRLRNELEGELLKDVPDAGKAQELTGKIGDLRTARQQERLATRLAVRELLTPEQRDKMLLRHQGRGRGGRQNGHPGQRPDCGSGRGHGRGGLGGDCRLEQTES